jgi:hypothetical protein
MKKHLSLLIITCISLSTIASSCPAWDAPLHSVKAKFTDPYIVSYGAFVVASPGAPNYSMQLQVAMDHSVPVKWKITLQVFGDWLSQPGGASYKSFDIVLNSSQWNKTVTIPLGWTEEPYTSLVDVLYDGPY